jgi:hypothetical protein
VAERQIFFGCGDDPLRYTCRQLPFNSGSFQESIKGSECFTWVDTFNGRIRSFLTSGRQSKSFTVRLFTIIRLCGRRVANIVRSVDPPQVV